MDPCAPLVQRIRTACPQFVIESVRAGGSGQFNDVLIVNDTLVFRFPRYVRQARRLPAQLAILRALRDQLSLPIPDPVYAGVESAAPGEAFIGYPLIPGVPLRRDTVAALPAQALSSVIGQLATFLRELHGILPGTITIDLSNQDGRDYWTDFYTRVRERLFPSMRADARATVARHFEAFLDAAPSFAYEPTIRHGDFGPENILFDPISQRITGVIDFDFAGLGDPATDLAVVLTPWGYGEQFIQAFCTQYPVPEAMLARGDFYRGTWALQEALHGVEEGDSGAFERGIASYR